MNKIEDLFSKICAGCQGTGLYDILLKYVGRVLRYICFMKNIVCYIEKGYVANVDRKILHCTLEKLLSARFADVPGWHKKKCTSKSDNSDCNAKRVESSCSSVVE